LVHDGDILFLDQSSSALFVAKAIMHTARVTVVTNNTEIISLLAQSEIDVISSGGRLSRTNRNCLLGEDAQRIFTQIRANLLFFSSKALSADGVIYDCDRDEVCIRSTMLANAEQKVFLCASEKYGHYAGYRQCTLEDVDYMISETNAPERFDTLQSYQSIILL